MRAPEFAIISHDDQKYGDTPYSVHLVQVVDILVNDLSISDDLILIDAAWLHDVLEDTSVTYDTLRREFGDDVTNIVRMVTDDDLPTRKQRKEAFVRRMSGIGFEDRDVIRRKAMIVKLCDRIANLRTGLREGNTRKLAMYVKEDETFRPLITDAVCGEPGGEHAKVLYQTVITLAEAYK